MIPLREAQAFVLEACGTLSPRPVPIDEALGCVVATPVLATEPVPPFVNSSRDGYALRARDTDSVVDGQPVRLTVVGLIMAGSTLDVPIEVGQAARIMTGAPLPEGADAVCMLEDCDDEAGGRVVVIGHRVTEGTAVRLVGEDVATGDTVAAAGTVLTPGHIGVLANQGMDKVVVHPRPRVGVLSTGDELVSTSDPLAPGQIRDANRRVLLALVRREGWIPVDLGIVGDDEELLTSALKGAANDCDVVITSGGVSVGDLDIVKVVLANQSGGTMRWMQVAIRPAKPFAFGILDGSDTPVFGLPGNPVSAMVSFELLVRPAVRRRGGHRSLDRPVVSARVESDLRRRPDGKTHFVRALGSLDQHGMWRVCPVDGQDSHQLRAMADANALAILPDGDGVRAGGVVALMLIDPDRISASTATPGAHRW